MQLWMKFILKLCQLKLRIGSIIYDLNVFLLVRNIKSGVQITLFDDLSAVQLLEICARCTALILTPDAWIGRYEKQH